MGNHSLEGEPAAPGKPSQETKGRHQELLQGSETASEKQPQPPGVLALVARLVASPCLSPGLPQVLSQQGLLYPRIYFLAENGSPPSTVHSF